MKGDVGIRKEGWGGKEGKKKRTDRKVCVGEGGGGAAEKLLHERGELA